MEPTTSPIAPINQSEVNTILWKACDTFRGTVDPSEYKNYILVMLFVKYISDVWHDHREEYERRYAGDQTRVDRQMQREPFRLPAGSDFQSLYSKRNLDNIGEEINKALEKIEEVNKEKLEGVFRNIDFNSESALGRAPERNTRLRNLLDDFNDKRLDLRPSRVGNLDVIGNAYEYLIGRFAAGAGKKAGEFYTPPEVSTLLAKLLDPQPGDRIYDPTCGSGSLLVKCAQQVNGDNYALWGQESNGSTWALCMMHLFLRQMKVTTRNIQWGDTLNNPLHLENGRLMRFDVVVANPPFSLDKWGADMAANDRYERFNRGIPPKGTGDYAFISHMIASMDPAPDSSARMGVIVTHSVLHRGGKEGAIRQQLIDENKLDAVIRLPANLFFGIGNPASILIFKQNRKADEPVIFIDASSEFESTRGLNFLRNSDIDRIVSIYKSRNSILGFSSAVDVHTIAQNGYNLNTPRYIVQETISDSRQNFITEWKGKHEIFLSYSRKNTETMNIIDEFLTGHGLRVWVDRNIEQGTVSWQRTIESAIEESFCIVVLLSPAAKTSEWVLKEIAFAQIHNKPIFPILVEGDLQSSLPFALAGAQHTLFESTHTQDQISNLRELAETILSKIGIIELTNTYFSNWSAFTKTKNWKLTTLGNCTQIIRPSHRQSDNYSDGDYPLYTRKGNITRYISEFNFDGDYILISQIKHNDELIHRVSGRFSTTGGLFLLEPKHNIVNVDFLNYILRITRLDDLFQGNAVGFLKLSDLRKVPIPLPPLEEQNDIAEDINEQVEITILSQKRLQAHLDILMHRPRGIIYQTLIEIRELDS